MNFSRHCNLCENKMTSLESGITCSLTNRTPEFNNSCLKITLEGKFQERLENVVLDLEILRRNRKLTHRKFYANIIVGFSLILFGYYFSDWKILSVHLWYVKLGIIAGGFSFLAKAYANLNRFRQKFKKAKSEKIKIDEVLDKYRINYESSFNFKEQIHGIQEVVVKLDFRNWTKANTKTVYKIDS